MEHKAQLPASRRQSAQQRHRIPAARELNGGPHARLEERGIERQALNRIGHRLRFGQTGHERMIARQRRSAWLSVPRCAALFRDAVSSITEPVTSESLVIHPESQKRGSNSLRKHHGTVFHNINDGAIGAAPLLELISCHAGLSNGTWPPMTNLPMEPLPTSPGLEIIGFVRPGDIAGASSTPARSGSHTILPRGLLTMQRSWIRVFRLQALLGTLFSACVSFAFAGSAPGPNHGLWVWKSPAILGAPQGAEALGKFCKSEGVNEVYVSVSASTFASEKESWLTLLLCCTAPIFESRRCSQAPMPTRRGNTETHC